ncbi:MAG TPA: PrsW family intramembrane metalloprotease [Geminicoccaceae bacterium]
MSFTLTIAALLPALLLVWYLIRRDLYPEPAPVLLGTFVLGGLAMLPAGAAVEGVRGPLLGGVEAVPIAALIYAFVIIAPLEELAKLGVLAGFAGRRTVFNEPMDGLIYGGVAGLGFAAAENVAYVTMGGLELAMLRAVTAVPMHAATGVVMGFFYGFARFVPERRPALLLYAVLVPIALHGAYNFPLILDEILAGLGRHAPWLPPIAIAALAFQIGLALALLRRVRLSQRAGHHEAAIDADFPSQHRPFQRFSRSRHLKGPAAVVIGGVLVWLTGSAVLTLAVGSLGEWLDADSGSPVGRARASAEEILEGLTAPEAATTAVLLVAALAFGLWLFGRGIVWLNRHDREDGVDGAPPARPVG